LQVVDGPIDGFLDNGILRPPPDLHSFEFRVHVEAGSWEGPWDNLATADPQSWVAARAPKVSPSVPRVLWEHPDKLPEALAMLLAPRPRIGAALPSPMASATAVARTAVLIKAVLGVRRVVELNWLDCNGGWFWVG
jgi:hypothetical protein